MKSRTILIMALVMAVITTVLFRQYLKELDKKYKAAQNKVNIVVARQEILKNQKITREQLELKEFSADSVHPQAIRKFEEIDGYFALTDLKAGEVLFASRFTNQFQETELITRKIREGYRAVSIEVNFVESVANLIQPEDIVDIAFSEKVQNPGTNPPVKTDTLLQNVRVLAVGKRISETQPVNKDAYGAQQNPGQADYNTITVELKLEDALRFINADERGSIRFVLRSKIAPDKN